jgi:hypothetical protein
VKWVVLAVALFGLVPYFAKRASTSLETRRWLAGLLAFDLFNPAHVNFLSDENYRGDSRGVEITTVDLLVLALFVGQRIRGASAPSTHRFRLVRGLYFLAAIVSITNSPDVLRSMFSIWKLLRMFFAFDVLASAFAEISVVEAALTGLAVGVTSQGLMALWQKYVYHAVRVMGSQSHPNSLAMIVNLVSPIAFALILAGRARRIAGVVFVFAAMCDIFSLCRGGMMMFVLGATLVTLVSMIRQPTPRKVRIVALLLVGAVAVIAKSAETIIKRFTEAPKESEQARKLFNAAAKMMADEHTFGVGINMFSWSLDKFGYADRLGIEPGDRNGIAHHIYWLTSAELGYVGAGAYILMLAAVYVAALRAAVMRGVRGEVGLGIAVGLTLTYLQGTAEWIARQTTMSYCFWLFAAIVSSFLAARAAGRLEA